MTLQGPEQLGLFWELLSRYHGDEGTTGPSFEPVTRAPLVVACRCRARTSSPRPLRAPGQGLDGTGGRGHWPVPYWDIDTGFTALLMLLTAVDDGLGALFFGIPPQQIGESLPGLYGVPGNYPADRRGGHRSSGSRGRQGRLRQVILLL